MWNQARHRIADQTQKVFKSHGRVAKEESFAADGNPVHLLAIDGSRSVLTDLDAWHLLEQVFQHRIFACAEGRCVVNDGIVLDGDGIASHRDGSRINQFRVFFHTDGAKVQIPSGCLVDVIGLGESLITQQFCA